MYIWIYGRPESGFKTAGFLKLEETDGGLRWQMSIRGLEKTDTGFFDLRDETGALVDKLLLQKGEGRYERSMLAAETTRGGRLFGEICGLRAELTGGRYLKGTWKLSGRREIPESENAEKEEPKPHPSPKPHPAPNPRPSRFRSRIQTQFQNRVHFRLRTLRMKQTGCRNRTFRAGCLGKRKYKSGPRRKKKSGCRLQPGRFSVRTNGSS